MASFASEQGECNAPPRYQRLHLPSATGRHSLPLDKIKLPSGFTISVYADNVLVARSMALSPDGALLVAEVNRIMHRFRFRLLM